MSTFGFHTSKGQIISEGFFGVLGFSQKKNKRIRRSSKNVLYVCFLEEFEDTKSPFKTIWPLWIHRNHFWIPVRDFEKSHFLSLHMKAFCLKIIKFHAGVKKCSFDWPFFHVDDQVKFCGLLRKLCHLLRPYFVLPKTHKGLVMQFNLWLLDLKDRADGTILTFKLCGNLKVS